MADGKLHPLMVEFHLVGGLEHEFYDFIEIYFFLYGFYGLYNMVYMEYLGNFMIPTDELSFFSEGLGRSTTNQP